MINAVILFINTMINKHSELLENKSKFIQYYNKELHNRLMAIGFLKNVNYALIPDIQFVEFAVGDTIYCMVEQFYSNIFYFVFERIVNKYPYIDIEKIDNNKNVRKIIIALKIGIMGSNIDLSKKNMIKETLQRVVTDKILKFCHVNSLQIV